MNQRMRSFVQGVGFALLLAIIGFNILDWQWWMMGFGCVALSNIPVDDKK